MRTRPVDLVEVDDIDVAGQLLLDGEVDAVVDDAPALDWFSSCGEGQGRTALVGGVFDPEYYAVATDEGSELTERIDRALLETREDGTCSRSTTSGSGETRAPRAASRPPTFTDGQ